MTDIAGARGALVTRILDGDGAASREERRAAFDDASDLALIDAVAQNASGVTDEQLAAARAAGLSDDQIFELVVCAAVGEATRLHTAALAALEGE